MTLNLKTILIILVLIGVGWYVYVEYLKPVESEDMQELLDTYRSVSRVKQRQVQKQIEKVYQRNEHYELLLAIMTDEDEAPALQELAATLFAIKGETDAVSALMHVLADTNRPAGVRAAAIRSAGLLSGRSHPDYNKIVDKLIELTDDEEMHDVRVAAHETLEDLVPAGNGIVSFPGDGLRKRWEEIRKR